MRYASGMAMRDGYSEIANGVSVPNEAITEGVYVQWNHIDGPLMHWAGHLEWLTWRQRFAIWIGAATVDEIACEVWPHLARIRKRLLSPYATSIVQGEGE